MFAIATFCVLFAVSNVAVSHSGDTFQNKIMMEVSMFLEEFETKIMLQVENTVQQVSNFHRNHLYLLTGRN